jgi:hypothetical protein
MRIAIANRRDCPLELLAYITFQVSEVKFEILPSALKLREQFHQ